MCTHIILLRNVRYRLNKQNHQNFFVEGYEKPEKYFLPVDTTKRNAADLAEEISVLIKNKIFKNIVANKQQNDL